MQSDDDFFSFMGLPKELTTDTRPLRLRLGLLGGVKDDMLLPQRVFGSEMLCGGIEYRVLCVASDAYLPLKQMIAVPAALDFVTDRGDLRSVCGIITEASAGDSDGGLATYQVVLRDALSIMEKRINTRVFRSMSEVEIVQRIVFEWRHKEPSLGTFFTIELDVAFHLRACPQREFTMQHNESDAAFIRRLLKRRGIGWYIRAGAGKFPCHALVLFNNADSLRCSAAGIVRYHRAGATEERDSITSWTAVRSLQPGAVTRHSWNYRHPLGPDFMTISARSGVNQGPHGNALAATLDDYQILMPHAGADIEDFCRLGRLRMERHDYESKCFHGEGTVRDLCAGEYFQLSGHPEVDKHPPKERDFVVTALLVTAQNNLPKAMAARVERLFTLNRWMQGVHDVHAQQQTGSNASTAALHLRVQLTAVRRGVPIVPAYDARTDLPPALMQSAIVVGPPGEEVHCDLMGRVHIRFPGMRLADQEQAGAKNCAAALNGDSAWVRVASNWAGNGPGSLQQCGALGLPRVGTEVLVSFLGGDPDKPVIVGQMYNQAGHPPALSKRGELPGNRYLSGIKSREIKGERANQLRLDDTHGEISAQLASDHGNTELNLGYLTQARAYGEGAPRGQGAELRSDMAVAVRGAAGVLISASAGGGLTGPQLERSELHRILGGLQKLAEQLSRLAERCAAEPPQGPALQQLVEKIAQLHEGGMQVVAIDGPMGVAVNSGDSLLLGAVADIDVASSGDTRISAAGRSVMRAALSLGLFANQGDVKVTAASGKVQVQAQNSAMQLLAKQVLEIISTTDWINISARKGIRLNGGGTELVLSADGLEGDTAGKHIMHASEHQTMGPGGKPAKFPGATVCPTQAAAAAQAGDATVPLKD